MTMLKNQTVIPKNTHVIYSTLWKFNVAIENDH